MLVLLSQSDTEFVLFCLKPSLFARVWFPTTLGPLLRFGLIVVHWHEKLSGSLVTVDGTVSTACHNSETEWVTVVFTLFFLRPSFTHHVITHVCHSWPRSTFSLRLEVWKVLHVGLVEAREAGPCLEGKLYQETDVFFVWFFESLGPVSEYRTCPSVVVGTGTIDDWWRRQGCWNWTTDVPSLRSHPDPSRVVLGWRGRFLPVVGSSGRHRDSDLTVI